MRKELINFDFYSVCSMFSFDFIILNTDDKPVKMNDTPLPFSFRFLVSFRIILLNRIKSPAQQI